MLFFLHINDIHTVIDVLRFTMLSDYFFACLFWKECKGNCKKTIQMQLNKLQTWFTINKLSLNVCKTTFLLFGSKRVDAGEKLKLVDWLCETSFLGVIMGDNLCWKTQNKT